MRFHGKTVIVTGGASGTGAAAVRQFGREGANVVVADIDAVAAARVASEFKNAIPVTVDAADAASVEQAVKQSVDRFGRIDIAFINAGIIGLELPLHEIPLDDWHRVCSVNGDGVFYFMKYCIGAMLEAGGGTIVNMSSSSGLTGQKNISPYTYTKAGIIGLTRCAAIEYASHNIRVNAVAPTTVWTPLTERFIEEAPDPAAKRAVLEHYNPMPGSPTAADVASVVAFLASDDSAWITGQTIPIDGGYCAQ